MKNNKGTTEDIAKELLDLQQKYDALIGIHLEGIIDYEKNTSPSNSNSNWSKKKTSERIQHLEIEHLEMLRLKSDTLKFQSLSNEILILLNGNMSLKEIIDAVLKLIQQKMNISAVGMRLKVGDDFPYFSHVGFPEGFIKLENSITYLDPFGNLCRDESGKLKLKCACGLVVSGKSGNFITNNSYKLFELNSKADPKFNPRNACIHLKYGSILIFPIIANEVIVGTLQLNQKETGAFTNEDISFFEGICSNIDTAIMRKQAKQNLLEEHEKLIKITNQSPGVLYQYRLRPDGSSCVPFASEGIQNIYQVTPEEVREDASKIFDCIHPNDLEEVIASIQESALNLSPWKMEHRVKFNDGTTHYLSGEALPQLEKDGSVLWHGIVIDVTESKKIEKERKIIMERNRILVASAAFCIHEVDLLGNIISMNEAGLNMFGLKNEAEIIGVPYLKSVGKADFLRIKNLMKEAFQGKSSIFEFESTDEKSYQSNFTPLMNNIGEINSIMGISIDITERKLSEEKLRKLSQAVEQSPVAILITDLKGAIQYANPKFVESTGYSIDEVMGKNPRVLKSGHTSPEEYKNLWKTLSTGGDWHGEFHNKKKNGELYWESATISPIINTKGETTHFISIKEDITFRKDSELLMQQKNLEIELQNEDYKHLNEELVLAKEHAEESDRLKSAFLANMSHEIRTPMNGILGFAGLLKEPMLTGEEQKEYIDIIEKSGVRMLNIINDIIDISKIESGLMKVNIIDSNINEQLEYIYTFFKPEIESKGMTFLFKKETTTKDLIIKTDREKVFAILINLVKNAIKYSNEGSIEFGYVKKKKYLEFFIKDTGIGIPKNRLEAVFERFIQADISDKMAIQGAGLGLSISKAFVDMLGGEIWVESEERKGSTFYFTIPFNNKEKKSNEFENGLINNETEYPIKKLKILIAEDDEISKLYINKIVKTYAKEILNASNGVEAVEFCRNNPDIDLVLMDIGMPLMDGYEATRQIRQLNKDVIIVAQTAYGLSSDLQETIKVGCNNHISKPITKNEILNLMLKYFKE